MIFSPSSLILEKVKIYRFIKHRLANLCIGFSEFDIHHNQILALCDEFVPAHPPEYFFDRSKHFFQNIARGTTDPGYWLFNLSYLSS